MTLTLWILVVVDVALGVFAVLSLGGIRILRSHPPQDANKRAVQLLLAHLNTAQRKSYLTAGGFYAYSPREPEYAYYIHGRSMVKWYSKRLAGLVQAPYPMVEVGAYCIHTTISAPTADHMLALKLLIESDVERFKATAIFHHR